MRAEIKLDLANFNSVIQGKRQKVIAGNKRAAERIKDVVVDNVQANCPVRTGRYRDSWVSDSSVSSEGDGVDIAIIQSNVEYGPFLEYGTSKMAARPALRTGIAESVGQIEDIWRQELGGNG